jgi:hypothetical protein
MNDELIPAYWSPVLWWLHHHGPINYPPEIDKVMSGLTIHSLSYLLANQAEAEKIRAAVKSQLVVAVEELGAHHAAQKR